MPGKPERHGAAAVLIVLILIDGRKCRREEGRCGGVNGVTIRPLRPSNIILGHSFAMSFGRRHAQAGTDRHGAAAVLSLEF